MKKNDENNKHTNDPNNSNDKNQEQNSNSDAKKTENKNDNENNASNTKHENTTEAQVGVSIQAHGAVKPTNKFLESLSLENMKTMPNEIFFEQIILCFFKEYLSKKHSKISVDKDLFCEFAAACIEFNVLMKSFNIILTPKEEKKNVKNLMKEAQMQLGDSWYVMSSKWWDQWAEYVGYDNTDDIEDTSSTQQITTSSKPAQTLLRPLKIDNGDILDHRSHFTVLRKEIEEGRDYRLLPANVWNQLVELYGGGPAIERPVISTEKTVRMKILEYTMKKSLLDYIAREEEKQKLLKKR